MKTVENLGSALSRVDRAWARTLVLKHGYRKTFKALNLRTGDDPARLRRAAAGLAAALDDDG